MDDPNELIATVTGYQPAAVVTAACRVGLFDLLDDDPRSVGELAAAIGADGPGGLGALVTALDAIGIVRSVPEGITAGPLVADLRRGAPLAAIVEKEAFFARVWLDLDEVVLRDRPALTSWSQRLVDEPDRCRSFLEALVVLAERFGPELARLPALAPGKGVLDVGGGLGAHARMLTGAGSAVTLVELPAVAAWSRAALGDTPEIEVVAADVLEHPSCGVPAASHDATLVSHLLHDLDDRDALAVLEGARRAVVPDGAVVVSEIAADMVPGPLGPLFDVMMRVETGSSARPTTALVELLVRAGLRDVTRAPDPDPMTVVVAHKPRTGAADG